MGCSILLWRPQRNTRPHCAKPSHTPLVGNCKFVQGQGVEQSCILPNRRQAFFRNIGHLLFSIIVVSTSSTSHNVYRMHELCVKSSVMLLGKMLHACVSCELDKRLTCHSRNLTKIPATSRCKQSQFVVLFSKAHDWFKGKLLLLLRKVLCFQRALQAACRRLKPFDKVNPTKHLQFDKGRRKLLPKGEWYGTVRYGTVRYGTVRYGTVRYGTVRYGTVRYGTVRYRTVWYGMCPTALKIPVWLPPASSLCTGPGSVTGYHCTGLLQCAVSGGRGPRSYSNAAQTGWRHCWWGGGGVSALSSSARPCSVCFVPPWGILRSAN